MIAVEDYLRVICLSKLEKMIKTIKIKSNQINLYLSTEKKLIRFKLHMKKGNM